MRRLDSKTIHLSADHGAIAAALETEHTLIESALETLADAMLAGANLRTLAELMDMVVDFCVAHFEEEEAFLRPGQDGGLHAAAHRDMLARFRAARDSMREGRFEGTLDASDLLNQFHHHIAHFDRPAYAALLRRERERGDGGTPQQETNSA